MKEEKRHVGRPTNEEVKQRNTKKIFKILVPIIIVILVGTLYIGINNSKLKGAVTKVCPTGYEECKNKKNCECKSTIPTDGKVADDSCVSGYVEGQGSCYKKVSSVGGCPTGYEECKNKKNCECKQKTKNTFKNATQCKNAIIKSDGYNHSIYVSGVCYRTTKKTISCPTGSVKCSSTKCDCKEPVAYQDKATKCRDGYVESDGKCYKTAKKVSSVSTNDNKYNSSIPATDSDYIKVLLIGNSYTYYNGYGQMITKLAAKTGKKLIVVRATHGGYSASDLINPPKKGEKIQYVAWSSTINKTDNKFASGESSLKNIIKAKFGGEANYWDYVILQNNSTVAGTKTGDIKMYNYLVDNGVKFKKFMLNATHYGAGLGSSRKQQHINAAKKLNNSLTKKGNVANVSVIKSGNVIGKYGSAWTSDLILTDNPRHMSGRGAYLYALVTYAKIYGISEFAKNTSDSNFIPLYSDGTTKDFAPDKYNTEKCNQKISRCKVNKEMAKKLQSIVRNYYE